MNKKELAKKIAEYVLDTESEDFYENTSKKHVYYLAYSFLYGEKAADEIFDYVNLE